MNKTTDRMVKALELVATGLTGYRAGRAAGISPQALYMNPTYQKMMDARRAAGVNVRRAYPRKPRAAA